VRLCAPAKWQNRGVRIAPGGSKRARRSAVVVAAVVGGALVAWLAIGGARVRAAQRAVREAPELAAARRGAVLADALRDELAGVLGREAARPVAADPAPDAARDPREPLVLGHFALDRRGAAAARADRAAAARRAASLTVERQWFVDEVTRSLAGPLARAAAAANALGEPVRTQRSASPLGWRALAFAGEPALIAVREAHEPDGWLVEGFVIDRVALTGWLAARAGDAVAELRTGDRAAPRIAGDWQLEVTANPRARAAAARAADAIGRGFVRRFAIVGALALVAAWLAVRSLARAPRSAG
jgi:hypothetical protein